MKFARFAAVLTGLVLTALAGSSVLLADAGDIEINVATAESNFPEGIVFRVDAASEGVIDEVRVFIKKADQSGRSSYRSIDVEPGESVSGETLLPSGTGGDFFPPGTKISYYFEVRDKAGGVVQTEERDFVYEDNRFHWLSISEGLITVYYYSEYVEERARIILEAAKQTMDRMVDVLGIAPTDPLRIVTYNNYRHMVMALPFRSATVSQDLQAQGMAFSDERVLLIHGFDPTVTGTTSHEFTHLLVHEAAGGTTAAVPMWLNEGLAEYGNIDQTDEYDAALRYGIYTRRIKPLWYQNTFSGEPEDIIIAYGQGKSVVNFMVERWGEDKISELFEAVRQTTTSMSPCSGSTGWTSMASIRAWRQSHGHGTLATASGRAGQADGTNPTAESPRDQGADAHRSPEPSTLSPMSRAESDVEDWRPVDPAESDAAEPESEAGVHHPVPLNRAASLPIGPRSLYRWGTAADEGLIGRVLVALLRASCGCRIPRVGHIPGAPGHSSVAAPGLPSCRRIGEARADCSRHRLSARLPNLNRGACVHHVIPVGMAGENCR